MLPAPRCSRCALALAGCALLLSSSAWRSGRRRLPDRRSATWSGALSGAGDPGPLFVVRELRLPRALTGLLVGVAFGVSGALFQTITRNPLASPDIIGITAGRRRRRGRRHRARLGTAASALTALGLLGGAGSPPLLDLPAGLARRRHRLPARAGRHRRVAGCCTSATDYLLTRASSSQAQAALGWLVGNLNGRDLGARCVPLAVAAGACWCRRRAAARPLAADAAARRRRRPPASASPVQRSRLALLLVGRRRWSRSAPPRPARSRSSPSPRRRSPGGWPAPPGRRSAASALTGALVVLRADLVARTLHPRTRTAGRRGHRRRRRARPALAARPRQPRGLRRLNPCDHPTRPPARAARPGPAGERPAPGLRRPGGRRGPRPGRPAGPDHRHRRRQRLRQVHPAAGAGPAAHAPPRQPSCWTAARSTRCPTREVAQRLGILPQSPVAPEGMTVVDLVGRGRSPHQRWWRQWSQADERAVARGAGRDRHDRPRRPAGRRAVRRAAAAGLDRHGAGPGHRRCCCWTSRPPTSTSPTRSTCWTWSPTSTGVSGRTVVMVLHDLNQACRYADHLIAMKAGRIVAEGAAGRGDHRRAGRGGLRPALSGHRPTRSAAPRW